MNDDTDKPLNPVGDDALEARITAWVLGEASPFEAAELEALCARSPEARLFERRLRVLHGFITEDRKAGPEDEWKLPAEKRAKVEALFEEPVVLHAEDHPPGKVEVRYLRKPKPPLSSGRRALLALAACTVISVGGWALLTSVGDHSRVTFAARAKADVSQASVSRASKEAAVEELRRAVIVQQDAVEDKRKLLAQVIRMESAARSKDPGGMSIEDRSRFEEKAIKEGIAHQSFVDAQNDFDSSQRVLEQLQSKLAVEQAQLNGDMAALAMNEASGSALRQLRNHSPFTTKPPPASMPREAEELLAKQSAPQQQAEADPFADSSPLASVVPPPAPATAVPAKPGEPAAVGGPVAAHDRASADFIPPAGEAPIPGLPADGVAVTDIVTGGLRSGDGAINRNNIDAILNNPDRTPTDPNAPAAPAITGFFSEGEVAQRQQETKGEQPAGQGGGGGAPPMNLGLEDGLAAKDQAPSDGPDFGNLSTLGRLAEQPPAAEARFRMSIDGESGDRDASADVTSRVATLSDLARKKADAPREEAQPDLGKSDLLTDAAKSGLPRRFTTGTATETREKAKPLEGGFEDFAIQPTPESGGNAAGGGRNFWSLQDEGVKEQVTEPMAGAKAAERGAITGVDKLSTATGVAVADPALAVDAKPVMPELDQALNARFGTTRGFNEDESPAAAAVSFVRLHQEKANLESQLEVLSRYNGMQLMHYASGLSIPDNIVPVLLPQLQEAKRDLERLQSSGLGPDHPEFKRQAEAVSAMENELGEATGNLRETLHAKVALLKNQVEEVESKLDPETIREFSKFIMPAPVVPAPDPEPANEVSTAAEPFSTFSLHVSDASFKLAKAALDRGEVPAAESIRPEEFYNAFDYGDPAPGHGEPVACAVEQSAHPAIPQRNLLRIGVKTGSQGRGGSTPLHLTLLLDSSGSMEREDRTAGLANAVKQLSGLLKEGDKISVIGFARQPRLLADRLPGARAQELNALIAQTPSEGGTNLEEGLKLGEELALRQFNPAAQNRIVLFTDGAANLGDAMPETLQAKVEQMRQKGIAFDAAGFGADGLNDQLLERLTRNGNGRYYIVDDAADADANFAKQLAGAFRPAAENVKVQVRFNPARVAKYKLIGFEEHRLKKEDFRNDAVDAAEMAAEEAGNALYQIEALPQGEGEVGEVSVRFRDAASGQMVERTWTIPYEAQAPAFDQAKPSLQLAGLAAFAAEKLRAAPLADAVDFQQLAPVLAKVKARYPNSRPVAELEAMVGKLK